jgi:hypothetical protein
VLEAEAACARLEIAAAMRRYVALSRGCQEG